MALNNYQRMCYKRFGRIAEKGAPDKLRENIESAHIDIRAGAYLSCVWLNTILAAVISTVVFLSLIVLIPMDAMSITVLVVIPVGATILIYFYFMKMPALKARARGKKIDLHLPYALNFISAMSSAGITPTEIFRSLSKQDIYSEIKEESLWIYRDITLLGADVITAIKSNIKRTPSQKFKEFLQGTIVTITSGGSLKTYFMAKAKQYMWENRQAQKQMIESLGIMAESYVTAAVAGILMILIVIPLMMMISGDKSQINFLYFFILLVVPLIHIGFAVTIKSMCDRG